MIIVVYGIVLLLYWNFSVPIKLLAFIANLFLPDPLPFLDEIAMLALLAKHLSSGSKE